MGICNEKPEEIILSDKDQVEFLSIVKSMMSELETFVDKISVEEINYKMSLYLFILNCLRDITPYLDQLEKGRKCENGVKISLEEIFASIKENNRDKYYNSLLKLKYYFKD